MDEKTNQLIMAMNTFIDGKRRGKIFCGEIESMFSELYDDDKRFDNLQYGLAMFGEGASIEEDEKMIIKEFKHAKNIICVQNS